MMRVMGVVVALVLAVASWGAEASEDASWQRYRFEDDGFSIMSPVPLKLQTGGNSGTYSRSIIAGPVPRKLYMATAGNIQYTVSVIDFSKARLDGKPVNLID